MTMNLKSNAWSVYSSKGVCHKISGTIAYAITYVDNLLNDHDDMMYADIYCRGVHRVRIYDIKATQAGDAPIMYRDDIS